MSFRWRVIAVAGAATVAEAQGPPATTAKFLGALKVHHAAASLKVRYSCDTGQNLWVSAKQSKSGAKDKALKKEGSSKTAAAWWHSHRNKLICTGSDHTATVTVDKVEQGAKGKLRSGYAWIQFCVTTGTTEADTKLTVYKTGWVKVRA